MARIIELDQNMINMIAAGEVIERPANVAKELMENSIDAGATRITLKVAQGGIKEITVIDNGKAIEPEDLEAAFAPHSTSKLHTAEDLDKIATLGFRGEALASISSVARITACTRTANSHQGHQMQIDCGKKSPIQPASCDYGTRIQVEDIFYKLPARRKFLKTPNTEFGHILKHFTRIALANRQLDMTLIRDGKELYRLSADQPLRHRIAELFSPEIAENLLETRTDDKDIRIHALLGTPQIARTNSQMQFVFLNGRFIRDKFISHAVKEAYRGHIDPARYPTVFLFIQMPPQAFDVNVHPTKIEVRFYNSNLLHSQVLSALRQKLLASDMDALARAPKEPPLQPDSDLQSKPQTDQQKRISRAMEDFFKKYKTTPQRQFSFSGQKPAKQKGHIHIEPADAQPEPTAPQAAPDFMQINDSYIVAATGDGFVVIDQHALHERILYEDLAKRIDKSNLESQSLLIPETVQLNASQQQILEENQHLLEKLGISVSPFGPKTVSVQAFPTLLSRANTADFLADLLDMLEEKAPNQNPKALLDDVLHMAACKAAIKAGQRLNSHEIRELLARKTETDHRSRCPHGRPTTIKFSITELEKQFKRT